MEKFNLDDHIKKALENIQEPFQANHWELFEQELNAPANMDLSERADDHVIREKLFNLSPKANPAHWEALVAKMAALSIDPIMEDVLIDGVAYENLHDLNPQYDEAHWELMEEKIEAELGWQNKVVRYKVVELSLVMLFLFTFLQFWPNAKVIIPKLIQQFPAEQKVQPNTSKSETPTKVLSNTSNEPIASNELNSDAGSNGANINEFENLTEGFPAAGLFTPILKKNIREKVGGDSQKNNIVRVVEDVPMLENLSAQVVTKPANESSDSNNPTVDPNYEFASFAMLSNLDDGFLEEPDLGFPDCDDCLKSKNPSYFRIGMKGIGNLDFYSTEKAPESSLNRVTQFVELDTVRPSIAEHFCPDIKELVGLVRN